MSERISRRALLGGGLALGAGMLLSDRAEAAPKRRVMVWSEGTAPKDIYPHDVNTAIADGLQPLKGWDVVIANLSDPNQGLTEEALAKTDVLIWWGHERHGDVTPENVDRVTRHVKERGMGFIATHSAHYSLPLKKILGTNCGWAGGYVNDGSALQVIVKEPKHPIAKGLKDFTCPHTERYSEPFECPVPKAVVFDGIYTRPDGTKENSRQGLVWTVGKGKVFYFQPGHESYPMYYQAEIRQVFRNAVPWAAPKR